MSVGTFLYYLKLLAVCEETRSNVMEAFNVGHSVLFFHLY